MLGCDKQHRNTAGQRYVVDFLRRERKSVRSPRVIERLIAASQSTTTLIKISLLGSVRRSEPRFDKRRSFINAQTATWVSSSNFIWRWRIPLKAGAMPGMHRDPFDRLLIAQALIEDLILVSNETVFDGFGVQRLW